MFMALLVVVGFASARHSRVKGHSYGLHWLWRGVCPPRPRRVTSYLRGLGLKAGCYGPLLAMFHSAAVDVDKLASLWTENVLARLDNQLLKIEGRIILLADGIKIAKSGRKMPAVKRLHQESENNDKAEYIFGHSCQTVSLLRKRLPVFSIPLCCRIHEVSSTTTLTKTGHSWTNWCAWR